MLRRRSIRTKLSISVGLLSAIVLLLASSGLWGLYSYQRLAKAVSQRAIEIPLANGLSRSAETLRDSNNHINGLLHNGGMIDAGLLENPLTDLERERFKQALQDIERGLQRYEDLVDAVAEDETNPLVDSVSVRRNLDEIRKSVESLSTFHPSIQSMDFAGKSTLSARLEDLVKQTDEHLAGIHSSMSEFSQDVRGQYQSWTLVAWGCTIISMVMVALLLWSFHSLVVQPFRTLLDGSRLVARGQLSHRIDLGTGDELSELAEAMNEMTARFQKAYSRVNSLCNDLDRQVRERSREVIQNEQLASVGFLAAGVAHEINNPLATIAWSAESLETRLDEVLQIGGETNSNDVELFSGMRTSLRRVQDEAYRCKGITERLLDFSRLGSVRRASTDITQLVEEVVSLVSKVGRYRCKTLRTHFVAPVSAYVNPQEIRQVVLNLVTNALESVDADGAVDIHVVEEDNTARVIVKDNGCGMSEEVQKHLFEPFFTRRRDGTGTGLGLSITYRIICQHGGSLAAFSEGEGCGSVMQVSLPMGVDNKDSSTRIHHSPERNHEPIEAA